MQINNDMLSKLRSLNDRELREAIDTVAKALGANDKQRRQAQNNTELIKRKLRGATPRDVEKLLGKLTPEQTSEIFRNLKL